MKAFRSPGFLRAAAFGYIPQEAFSSAEFVEALAQDYQSLDLRSYEDAEQLFGELRPTSLFWGDSRCQITAWEHILRTLRMTDTIRYETMHKGSPYYFLGEASYLIQDFESALFYMDCALAEDYRLNIENDRWRQLPAGRFVRLDEQAPQSAHDLLLRTRSLLESWGNRVANAGGVGLSIEDYRTKLVNHAVKREPSLRSAVTTYLSFLLETQARQTQILLAPPELFGSGEPFFLHLLKGCVLFETLLKHSNRGQRVVGLEPGATINTLLQDQSIYSALGFRIRPQGFGARTLPDLLVRIKRERADPFSLRSVKTAWNLRNLTGHSLAWPRRPTIQEYEELLLLVFGCLNLVLETLYTECLLTDGTR